MKKLLVLATLLASVVHAAVVPVPLTANLLNVFSAAKANTTYQLAKNGKYTLNGSATISQPNVTIDLNGSSLTMIPSPGASSDLIIKGAHFTFGNGSIVKANLAIRSYAPFAYIHQINFSNIQQIFIGDVGSNNNTLNHIVGGQTGTVSVYWTENNMTIENSSFVGSVGEATLRQENPTGSVAGPTGAMIVNDVLSNSVNVYGKPTIADRMGSMTVKNCTIDGYLDSGETIGPAGPGGYVPLITIQNTKFDIAKNGKISGGFIAGGVNAIFNACTFATTLTMPNISVQSNSKVTLTNNIRKMVVKGQPARPLAVAQVGGQIIEVGTKVVQP